MDCSWRGCRPRSLAASRSASAVSKYAKMLSMDMHSAGKLNHLQQELPEGLLADAAWMKAHGYSSALRSQYVRAGWLDSPARRVYRRSRTPLTWQQVAVSLKKVPDL